MRKGKDLQLGCRYGYIYLPGTWVPTQQGRHMRYVDTQVGTVTVPPSKQLFVLEQQCFLKQRKKKCIGTWPMSGGACRRRGGK
jgi:hypothetical protein